MLKAKICKEKMAKNNYEEINFQHYVDSVKQRRIDWNMFVDVMRDISYSDMGRLRRLNAILVNELTMDYSDMDKLKYLNVILLREFKKDIQKEQNFEKIQNEELVNSEEANIYENLNEDGNSKNEENLAASCKEEIIESNAASESNAKIFLCYICNKEYNMYFHLKQHIKNVHEKKKSNTLQLTNNQIIQKIDEHKW